jgi:hypothetical protein
MSQIRDIQLFDLIVILGFVGVVGYFAQRSRAPKTSSIPGVVWTQAPAPAPKLSPAKLNPALSNESGGVSEADALAPAEQLLDLPVEDSAASEAPAEEGSWE